MSPSESGTRTALAEAIGTFALVLVGTGAIVVDEASGGSVTHAGISVAFGLTVMTMIYAVGDVSGAHFNPAVTVGFWIAGRFPGARVAPYVAAQCAGAVLASALLRLWFPANASLGGTAPSGSLFQSLSVEVVLTFFLMFVILSVSTGAKEKGLMAGVAIGGTVALCALAFGPVSGASMNPARSLGPALVSGAWGPFWLYVVGPVTGAALAVGACVCVREPGCCSRAEIA